MADIQTNEELDLWLQGLSREEIVAVAARIALRATPVWPQDLKVRADFRHAFLKRTWRAIDVAIFSVRRGEERAAVAAATVFPANRSDAYAYSSAAAAVGAAVNAAASPSSRRRSSFGAFLADLEIHVESGNPAMWLSLSQDAAALGRGVSPELLLEAPLWAEGVPDKTLAEWEELKSGLSRFPKEHWGVWTKWIEDRFFGRPIDWALQRDRVLIPFQEGLWLQDPAQINARIRRVLQEYGDEAPHLPAEEAAVPERASVFFAGGDDDYAAARESLNALLRLASESGVRLKEVRERTQKALEALGGSWEGIRPGALLRAVRRFRSLRAIDDLRRKIQDPHDLPLRPGERLILEDVLGDLEALASAPFSLAEEEEQAY